MSTQTIDLRRDVDLRTRAVSRLSGGGAAADAPLSAAKAFAVLHALATSASTAGDALALMHELQVHQVELELQREEMQRAVAELEAGLARQTRLYDHAPVALLSLDAEGRLVELNLAAARLLGLQRDALIGRALLDFLATDSRTALNALLGRAVVAGGSPTPGIELALREDPSTRVRASVSADPAGDGFLLALAHGRVD